MKTKLVYVLTCAPTGNYIEQALMSVWSARHWNPDAHIVLITDNLTDQLFVGKRAEILDYISEKIVVPFEDDSLSMVYRSRWLKTSVRQWVDGDYLFLDTDTIVCASLMECDQYTNDVLAVYDALLPLDQYCEDLYDVPNKRCAILGVDLQQEKYYYNSGVMYVRDTLTTHKLYALWHTYWLEGIKKNLMSDQPSLCKANRDVNHIIYRLDDEYNLITYTQDRRYRNAKILHISFFRNASYLQSKKVLMFVKNNGIHNSWLKKSILHPECTFFPFNNEIYSSTCKDRWCWTYQIAEYAAGYGQFIDPNFEVLKVPSCLNSLIHWCFVKQWFKLGAWIWLNWCYCHLYLKHFKPYANLFQNTYESVDV